MKKILSAVAAFGLVAAVATTASALDFSVSGSYSVTGNYLSDSDGQGLIVNEALANDDNAPDAYWMHTFAIKPVMTVNDKITMFSEVRLADNTVWGSQTGGDVNAAGSTVSGTAGDVYVHRLYMQYMSPIGKVQVGRLSSGPWGTPFLDTDGRANGIKLWPSALASGPWSTYFYVGKGNESDAQTTANNSVADGDSDSYEGRIYYKDDALDAGMRYNYTDNDSTAANQNISTTILGVYGVYKWSNYFFATEIVSYGGTTETDGATADVDRSGTAALLEIGGQFDNLSVAAAYVYASGDDNTADNDNENFAMMNSGLGTEFTPLYILTGRGMGCLNADINAADNLTGGAVANAGTHTFAILADYKASDRLTLHGAIAYAQADEEVDNGALGVTSYAGRDSDYGMEYDLGAAYKLLDNLTYEAHFGYLATGDFFKPNATTDTTTSVYVLTHSLTMTF